MTHGDITADEVYADRQMLERLGYGIFDVTWGSAGVGFENIKDFSYVVTQDKDPKLYRRRVFDLTGHYYPNELAKQIWNKVIDHKWVLSEQAGREIDLRQAAQDWYQQHGHAFLKEWTFRQAEIPNRIRNRSEPQKGLLGLVAHRLMPNLRELLDAGFTVTDLARAAIVEAVAPGIWRKMQPRKKTRRWGVNSGRKDFKRARLSKNNVNSGEANWQDDNHYLTVKKVDPAEIDEGRYYVRMVANLTGHEPQSQKEAERRWREILEHKWFMSERAGHDIGLRLAALDYFRRLNLLQEAETGEED